jgi:hypothetical protein
VMTRRRLDVSRGHTADGEGGDEEEKNAFFHSGKLDLANRQRPWQERSRFFSKKPS